MSTVKAYCALCDRWFYDEREDSSYAFCPACLTVGALVDEAANL
jgi:hypothetical protein